MTSGRTKRERCAAFLMPSETVPQAHNERADQFVGSVDGIKLGCKPTRTSAKPQRNQRRAEWLRLSCLLRVGYFRPVSAGKGQNFYGLDEIDRTLRSFMPYRGGFFVELGANDGVTQSNTLHFERELGWKGVLIEPIPHQFLACLKNRSRENKIFCAACVPNDYDKEFVKIIYSNLMSIAPDFQSDVGDAMEHARAGRQFLCSHEENFIFGAVARTLTSILIEANAPTMIDPLSLDVEGNEIDVLRGLDFSVFKCKHIVVESMNFNRT
jgi:FkbM family methyltransferase